MNRPFEGGFEATLGISMAICYHVFSALELTLFDGPIQCIRQTQTSLVRLLAGLTKQTSLKQNQKQPNLIAPRQSCACTCSCPMRIRKRRKLHDRMRPDSNHRPLDHIARAQD